jgi:hypothetical protein
MDVARAALAALCLVAAGCTTITMRISRDELEANLARRFPRELDEHVVTVRMSDPRIDFPGTPDRIGIRLRVEVTSASGRSQLPGAARVEGRIEYVAAEHAFYIRDPRVTELRLDPPEGRGSLSRLARRARHLRGAELAAPVVRAALAELLGRHPVYRLDARRSEREAKAIRHLRRVRIDDQDLVLELGL